MTNENQNQRSASDVLLELERKVDTLLKVQTNTDMLLKLTVERLNNLLKQSGVNPSIGSSNISFPAANLQIQQGSQVPQVPQVPQVSNEPIKISANDAILVETKPITRQRNSQTTTMRKVPVVQRIVDSNGKDLFMADIEILDSQKNIVNKVKTNAMGNWQAILLPGIYQLHIVKTDTATKQKFELSQEIEIPDSNSPVKLPPIVIKR